MTAGGFVDNIVVIWVRDYWIRADYCSSIFLKSRRFALFKGGSIMPYEWLGNQILTVSTYVFIDVVDCG